MWSLAAVRAATDAAAAAQPRLLCTMTNHAASVNAVRWSPDGMLLASGADDGVVLVWVLAHGARRLRQLVFLLMLVG